VPRLFVRAGRREATVGLTLGSWSTNGVDEIDDARQQSKAGVLDSCCCR
jgi:hypothetical protein